MKARRSELLRILDANFNRSREGLRVCEEITRFVLDDDALTKRLKSARHAVSACFRRLSSLELVAARDSEGDVGREPSALEAGREGFTGLFLANIERAKESLRVLEETAKLVEPSLSKKFKAVRFDVYELEKRTLPKLAALRDHRPRRGRKKGA